MWDSLKGLREAAEMLLGLRPFPFPNDVMKKFLEKKPKDKPATA